MDERRVVVTGATGFIGRWSIPALRLRGYEVHALTSRSATQSVLPEGDNAAWHVVDLFDSAAVTYLFKELRPTHLLHFAWIATPGLYWTSSDNFRWVAASLEMLSTFHRAGGRRVVMAGSCAEYDWRSAALCREYETPLATDGTDRSAPYATCKIALQKMLSAYGRQEGLSTAWGRIFAAYGPHEHPARLTPTVIRSLLSGEPALCSAGFQVRNYIPSAEVGSAFAALLDSAVEGALNIGSDEHCSIADLVREIASLVGRPDLIRFGVKPAPEGEPAILVPDVRRLFEEVGWRPKISRSEGLKSTIFWWQASK